ncbi:hypothetical protein H1C71_039037 [Ictidomys tridecemlineatus]|nr:hypothetical protein H1C71_039037 [Ictidomys tridecemlineatus]
MQPESRAHGELYNRRLLWSDLCQLHRGHWFSADTTSLLECGMEMTSLSWLVSDPGLGQVSFSLHLITGQTQQNSQPLPGEASGPVGPALILACSSVVEPRDGR